MTHALVVEEVARACSATGFTVSFHAGIIGTTLALNATPEQKSKYLVPLAKGEHMGAFMLTEPQAGTDVMAISTTAVRDGDHYVIDGTKTFVSNGPFADTYILFWTDRPAGRKGMSAFIVPKGSPGLVPGKHFDKMGLRASQTSEVVFRKCRIPAGNLLGKEGAGFPMAMTGFDHGRIGIAAQAVGMLQAALDESIRYSKERVQMGSPIARHQAISWMIADMATDLSAARFLALHAAWLKDQGLPFGKRLRWPSSSRRRRRCITPSRPSRSTAAAATSRAPRWSG